MRFEYRHSSEQPWTIGNPDTVIALNGNTGIELRVIGAHAVNFDDNIGIQRIAEAGLRTTFEYSPRLPDDSETVIELFDNLHFTRTANPCLLCYDPSIQAEKDDVIAIPVNTCWLIDPTESIVHSILIPAGRPISSTFSAVYCKKICGFSIRNTSCTRSYGFSFSSIPGRQIHESSSIKASGIV